MTKPTHAEWLAHYRKQPINFVRPALDERTQGNGWRLHDRQIALQAEPMGEPIRNGSWELAQKALLTYDFADKSLLEAVFDPQEPLEGRTLLLIGKFLWMRFYFGGRVSHVVDEIRQENGQAVRLWGYGYATLEGHYEQGELSYELRKVLDTGHVHFRMTAYVRIGYIDNPLHRLGFRWVMPFVSARFYQTALRNMAVMTTYA